MRFSIAVLMCIMLLGLALLMPAAGAVYIEGQPTPDDGQVHILSADESTPASNDVSDSADPILLSEAAPVLIATPGLSPMYYNPCDIQVAMPVMPAEMMAYDPALVTRVCDGISPAICGFPEICVPYTQCPSMPIVDMGIGDSIGHYAAPMIPGYWDNIDPSSLYTNMPVI